MRLVKGRVVVSTEVGGLGLSREKVGRETTSLIRGGRNRVGRSRRLVCCGLTRLATRFDWVGAVIRDDGAREGPTQCGLSIG